MALLLLSYDTTKETYDAMPFRKALIKILLDNGATELKSYVASTIHFKTHKHEPIKFWTTLLENYNGSDFRFVICEVVRNSDGNLALDYKGKKSQRFNFSEEVEAVEKNL